MKNRDKYRGCLIGGAAGDALGYAVEFYKDYDIFQMYGENGITDYRLKNGIAQFSDDTQMTLFTANGLLAGETHAIAQGRKAEHAEYIDAIAKCYIEWLYTQYENYPADIQNQYSWLMNVPMLYSQRAPGNTCVIAIENGAKGTIQNPVNSSKGCGGVMRVAPIGLYFDEARYSKEEIDMIGAEAAAITHGHELGYIPSAGLVHIVNLVSRNDDISLIDAVLDMKDSLNRQFAGAKHLQEQIDLIDKAIELSESDIEDLEAIKQLGAGWVAEETLAIAIYCALKYSDDFDKAMIASVNHSGDSDSTGAVAGNILGAYLGLSKIPDKYLNYLELKDVILQIADDLYDGCKVSENGEIQDEMWKKKYLDATYIYPF